MQGHAPAGGCLLALSSEYRAMVGGKYAIGLNETALGIVAPVWFQDCLFRTISPRQAEVALTLGSMFPVDEAFKVITLFQPWSMINMVYSQYGRCSTWLVSSKYGRWSKWLVVGECGPWSTSLVGGKYAIGLNETELGTVVPGPLGPPARGRLKWRLR